MPDNFTHADFSYTADSNGYMVHFRGNPIGGASTIAKDRRHRNGAMVAADRKSHRESAQRTIDELVSGRGRADLRESIRQILEGIRKDVKPQQQTESINTQLLEALKRLRAAVHEHHLLDVKKRYGLCTADAAAGTAIHNAETSNQKRVAIAASSGEPQLPDNPDPNPPDKCETEEQPERRGPICPECLASVECRQQTQCTACGLQFTLWEPPEAVFTEDESALDCPECGNHCLPRLVELGHEVTHDLSSIDQQNKTVYASGWDGSSSDVTEEGTGYVLECPKCCTQYSLPKGYEIEWQ